MNNEEMRKMWEAAANESYLPTKHKPLTDKAFHDSIRDQAIQAWGKGSSPVPIDQGNIIYDGARERSGMPPRKPWAGRPEESSSLTPHETHILNIQQRAKTQGRPLTADENAAIARHRQNAVDAARRSKPEPK